MTIFDELKAPFAHSDIDWRIGQAGKNRNGYWAKVLAYLTSRSVMDRLDSVLGPQNWRTEYVGAPNDPEHKSLICTLYLRIDGEWIGKSDGASNSDIEPVKGGISDSFKRAAVQWGIGRYLYDLGENWATITEQKEQGSHYANCKIKVDGKEEWASFYWHPPRLPDWALPPATKPNPTAGLPPGVTTADKVPPPKNKKPSAPPQKSAYEIACETIDKALASGDTAKLALCETRVLERHKDGSLTDQEYQDLVGRLAKSPAAA